MIRHARFGLTRPIVALTYPVRPPAGIAMPTIAMTADAKNNPPATTTSHSENEFGESTIDGKLYTRQVDEKDRD